MLSPGVTETGLPDPQLDARKRTASGSGSTGVYTLSSSSGTPPGSALRVGTRTNSSGGMLRLPDDLSGVVPPLSPGATCAVEGSRPSSALKPQQPGMVRLPSETPSTATPSAPIQSPTVPASRGLPPVGASLSRLPDSPLGSAPRSPAAPAPAGGCGRSAVPGSSIRDRMKMQLSVNTHVPAKDSMNNSFKLLSEGQSIHDFFDFADELQQCGDKGRVVTAVSKGDNSEVVIKIRTKRGSKTTERNWRAVMSQLQGVTNGSKNVLDITEILEDDQAFYVVMPKCNGGELFEFLITEAEVPESECKRIISEILLALGHLHEHNLIHRDVKPENLLFDLDRGLPLQSPKTVKLIDFDTCVEWTPQTPKLKHFVGTPGYIAPEALLGEASPQSDLWSVGVILYILMTGETPWTSIESLQDGTVGSPGAKRMYNSLKTAEMDWETEPWPSFPEARDLCQKLTAFKTAERIFSVAEAMSHPWLA